MANRVVKIGGVYFRISDHDAERVGEREYTDYVCSPDGILGEMQAEVRAIAEGRGGYRFPSHLKGLGDDAIIEASKSDREAWRLLRHCAVQSVGFNVDHPGLNRWALEVAAGERAEPKRRGRPAEAARDLVIITAIRGLHDLHGWTFEQARYAIHERLRLSEDAIDTIWKARKKSANCSP